VHHSYIWLESVRTIFIIAVCVVVANFSTIIGLVAEEGMGAEAGFIMAVAGIGTLVVILLTFGIVAGLRVVGYKHLYFTVGPDEFTLCSGIFNKKQVHVPYQRVQSVDQRATLLQRLFGVCTVSIDTAGGAANKAVVVPYVTKAQAEWLRAELYNRKNALAAQAAVASGMAGAASATATGMAGAPVPQSVEAGVAAMAQGAAAFAGNVPSPAVAGNVLDVGAEAWNQVGGVFAGPAQDTGRVTYEYGLTNKELFFAGLSNSTSVGLIFAGLVVGVLQIVSFIFDVMGDAADGAVESAVAFAGSQASAYLIGVVSVGIIVLVLVLWVFSALGSCIGYGGFKARRRNNRIEVEYGLLQHTFQGIDIDRVQSVVVKQSFIRRLLGYCELSLGKIDAATGEDSGNKQNTLANQGIIIHPFVKMNRVPEILAGLVPEFSDLPQEAKPVAKVALRRAVLRQSIWFGGGFWLAVVVTVCLMVFGWVNGSCDWRHRARFRGSVPFEHWVERDRGGWLCAGGRPLHRGYSERRAVGPRVQLRLQPPLHAGEQRRPFAGNSEFPAPENPVRLHEEQPVAASCGHRHAARHDGGRFRRHHDDAHRRLSRRRHGVARLAEARRQPVIPENMVKYRS